MTASRPSSSAATIGPGPGRSTRAASLSLPWFPAASVSDEAQDSCTESFAALLEGAASFFTAQQRAMAAATDNADELVRTLTRVMNRARQDAITTEIMEIVGGAEALRQTKGA